MQKSKYIKNKIIKHTKSKIKNLNLQKLKYIINKIAIYIKNNKAKYNKSEIYNFNSAKLKHIKNKKIINI